MASRFLLLLSITACTVDLALPDEARVSCARNGDCPQGTVCKRNVGLCVSQDSDDGRAPGVVSVALTPSIATIGAELTLNLTVDEPLGAEPDVVFGANSRFSVLAVDATTNTYTLRYAIRGTEEQGTQAVSATLVDDFGNEAQLLVANATVDFIAPRIGNARWILPGDKVVVKPLDLVTLVASVDLDATLVGATLFSDSEEIADITGAFRAGAGDELGRLELRGELAVPSDVADGAFLAVGFALTDPAGNTTNPFAALSPGLLVDALAPQGALSLPATSTSATVNALLTSTDAVSVRFVGDVRSPVGRQSPVPTVVAIVLSDGNGVKSVSAVFEDAAANVLTTAPAFVDVDVPPGPGSPGVACNNDIDCNSLTCSCADPNCAGRRCAADPACGTCKYVNAAGVCQGDINPETADPRGCTTPQTCSRGTCFTARGRPCVQRSECVTGFCECKDASCSGRICTNADCDACAAGLDCEIARDDDTTCDTDQVCRLGQCVVRDPGRCIASCGDNRTCDGPSIAIDNCNAAQGFAANFTGFCPTQPPCDGAPDCTCL